MKARSVAEKEVVMLSASLPSLTPSQVEEAGKCAGSLYIGKHTGWCSCCGGEMDASALWQNRRRKAATCPRCGARLKITRAPQKMRQDDKYYYTVVTTAGGWQVLRNFYCSRTVIRALKVAGVEAADAIRNLVVTEVSQAWINAKGESVMMGRNVMSSPCHYIDMWKLYTPLTLKHDHRRYVISGFLGTGARLLPEVKRHGLLRLRDDCNFFDQISMVLRNSRSETLAKARQWGLFARSISYGDQIRRFWPSVRIAMRNGYKVKDASMWLDYLELLDENGRDLHNAFYVCPEDLKAAHDHFLTVDGKRRRKLEALREMKLVDQLKKGSPQNVAYRKLVGKDVLEKVVVAGDISIAPLQDVKDFYDEGKALHHCVFANRYFEHPSTLILGIKVSGQRMETAEICTDNWQVVQCRGKFNKPSPFHREILENIQQALPAFRECMQEIKGREVRCV